MSSESYHEPVEHLSERTKNFHRAIVSLREELEAIDWYQQRADACTDDALRAVLLHNKDEEIEHAMMVLEWLRRNDPVFARNVATYLNTTGDITQIEEKADAGAAEPAPPSDTLSVGSLRGER
jgi:ferritin-like protein